MDLEFDSTKEYPLDFSEGLSLQELASTKLALCLWRYTIYQKITPHNFIVWSVRHTCWFEEGSKFSCREILNAPTRITDVIDKRIELIREELKNWLKKVTMMYTNLFSLRDQSDELISILFGNIVLKPDGTFCLQSSARMALTNLSLSPVTMYKTACDFCLEEFVQQYWPLVENDVSERGQSLLVSYWNNVMSMTGRAVRVPQHTLDENPITLLVDDKNTVAFMYFWNKSNEQKQIFLTIEILRSFRVNFSTMKFLLAKLNKTQAKKVCQEAGDRIFSKMMIKDEHFEYTMNCWIFMKDFISVHVFFNIIRELLKLVSNHSMYVIDPSRSNRSDALLRDVWITAPERFKTPGLNRHIVNGLFKLLDVEVRGLDYDMTFLLEMLANADYKQRRTLWMQNWRKFIIRVKPSKLEELMRSCLANEEEIKHFKERKMASFEELESYFSSCIEKKMIAELCQYLSYYVQDPRRLENLSKEIILSNLHTILSWDDENELAKFHSLIHCTFRDLQSANKFIEELISAPEFLALVHSKLDDGFFDEVVNICGRFPTSERHLNETKRGLLDYCKNNLARGQIDGFVGHKFENFLSWCFLNETLISEFKQSFVIDDIFEIIVKKVIQEGLSMARPSQTLLNFNNFLEWYFGSSENAKIYKSSESVDRYLKWAFDNDSDKIADVKAILDK